VGTDDRHRRHGEATLIPAPSVGAYGFAAVAADAGERSGDGELVLRRQARRRAAGANRGYLMAGEPRLVGIMSTTTTERRRHGDGDRLAQGASGRHDAFRDRPRRQHARAVRREGSQASSATF